MNEKECRQLCLKKFCAGYTFGSMLGKRVNCYLHTKFCGGTLKNRKGAVAASKGRKLLEVERPPPPEPVKKYKDTTLDFSKFKRKESYQKTSGLSMNNCRSKCHTWSDFYCVAVVFDSKKMNCHLYGKLVKLPEVPMKTQKGSEMIVFPKRVATRFKEYADQDNYQFYKNADYSGGSRATSRVKDKAECMRGCMLRKNCRYATYYVARGRCRYNTKTVVRKLYGTGNVDTFLMTNLPRNIKRLKVDRN